MNDMAIDLMEQDHTAIDVCGDYVSVIKQTDDEIVYVTANQELVAYIYTPNMKRSLKEHGPAADIYTEKYFNTNLNFVDASRSRDDVVMLMSNWEFSEIPVIDKDQKLLGVIRLENLVESIEKESSEDMFQMVGVVYPYQNATSTLQKVKYRYPWLVPTILGCIIAAVILNVFSSVLESTIALAYFIPAVAALGGSVGIQSATIMTQWISQHPLAKSSKVLWDEFKSGFVVAILCGIVMMGFGCIFGINVGFAVGFAVWVSVLVSGGIGSLAPLICNKLGYDPAVASGPVVTSLNDILSVFIYLSIACVLI
jgi:magnesium transporter